MKKHFRNFAYAIMTLIVLTTPLLLYAQTDGQTQYYDGATSQWISSDNLFHNGVDVGIGLYPSQWRNLLPDGKLEINVPHTARGLIITNDATNCPPQTSCGPMHPYLEIRDFYLNQLATPTTLEANTHLIYTASQKFGIGTDNPVGKMHIVSPPNTNALHLTTEYEGGIFIERPAWAPGTQAMIGISGNGGPAGLRFQITPDNWTTWYDNAFFIGNNGKVGIGTVIPNENLTVSGNVQINGDLFISNGSGRQARISSNGLLVARQVDVHLDPIPDYVFHAAFDVDSALHYKETGFYERMDYKELEEFIKVNRHLPGIPSAAEYKEKGSVNLGELQMKLLEKIEELTLYNIELRREIEHLKKEVKEVKKTNTNN